MKDSLVDMSEICHPHHIIISFFSCFVKEIYEKLI